MRLTLPAALLVIALPGAFVRADYPVPCEQFDVSKVVRGKGEVEIACAAIEKRFSTAARKHFFGMRMPAAFAVEIPIGGDATTFEASCGVDKFCEKGKVVVKVIGDGRELWSSGVTAWGDTNEVPVKVDVRGVKILTLSADPVEGSGEGVGVVWGEAKLDYADGKVLPSDVRRQPRQLGILTPEVRLKPRVNGPQVYGVRPGRPILYRVPVTGEKPLKVSLTGLTGLPELENLVFDAKTQILSGSIKKPGDYPLTIAAENARGKDEKTLVIKVGETISLTPAMGWSSWNAFGGKVSDEKVRAAADALVSSGLADHGYSYINIDDFWQNIPEREKEDPSLDGPLRDAEGRIAAN